MQSTSQSRIFAVLRNLPLLALSLLLVWVAYVSFISIAVLYLLVERGRWALFAIHSALFCFLWGLTCWSLVVTVNRGPGYVETGTKREQDLQPGLPATTGTASRSRRGSNASSVNHDSGVGDVGRTEEETSLLAGEGTLPLQRIAQRAAEVIGFDAKPEAHPHGIQLSEDRLLTAKADGSVRYCRKVCFRLCITRSELIFSQQCQSVKPDRAHHCSICAKCVLQMDHHCPWISTCVGHRNRKAFVLFLTYGTLLAYYCALVAITTLRSYSHIHSVNYDYAPLSWAFLLLLGAVFGLVLSGFSGYHWWLIAKNRTTLENLEYSNRVRFTSSAVAASERYRSDFALSRQERKRLGRAAAKLNIFDLGTRENVANVFGPPRNGTSPYGLMGWIVPSGPVRGDGRTWPINEHHRDELERISREVRRMEVAIGSSDVSSGIPSASSFTTEESV